MITRRMDDKLEKLKAYFISKFNEQEEKLTQTFNNIIDDLKKRDHGANTKRSFKMI